MAKETVPVARVVRKPTTTTNVPMAALADPAHPHATGGARTTNVATSFPTTSIPAPAGAAQTTNPAMNFSPNSVPTPAAAGAYTPSDSGTNQSATAHSIASSEGSQVFVGVEILLQKHAHQVKQFREWCSAKNFRALHDAHFDWYIYIYIYSRELAVLHITII